MFVQTCLVESLQDGSEIADPNLLPDGDEPMACSPCGAGVTSDPYCTDVPLLAACENLHCSFCGSMVEVVVPKRLKKKTPPVMKCPQCKTLAMQCYRAFGKWPTPEFCALSEKERRELINITWHKFDPNHCPEKPKHIHMVAMHPRHIPKLPK